MEKPADAAHPIHALVRDRYSPRAFGDQALELAEIQSLMEAARWAPSSMNEQPWRFVVTRRPSDGFDRLAAALASGNRPWASRAGALIAVTVSETFRRNDKPNIHAWHDVGLAVATLTLQATALGLGVHQMGGIDSDAVRAACEVPAEYAIISVLAVGHVGEVSDLSEELAERERAPRNRLAPAEIVFSDRFGEPL